MKQTRVVPAGLVLVVGLLSVPTASWASDAVPTSATSLAHPDAMLEGLLSYPGGWERALDIKGPDLLINHDAVTAAVEHTLTKQRLRQPSSRDLGQIRMLVRLVGLKNVGGARPLLQKWIYDPEVSVLVRCEIAQSLARTADATEIAAMLDSGVDVVVASAIDWAGDSVAPNVRSRIDKLLRLLEDSDRSKLPGPYTGQALLFVAQARLFSKSWERISTPEEQIDYLASQLLFLFDRKADPHRGDVRADNAAARWLERRLFELHATSPELVIAKLRQKGTDEWSSRFVEQELLKPRSLFFLGTRPAQASQPASAGSDLKTGHPLAQP